MKGFGWMMRLKRCWTHFNRPEKLNNQPKTAVQVCFELNNDNLAREKNGLLDAMNFLNLDNGYIITAEKKDKIAIGKKTIEVLPFYEVRFEDLTAGR